MVGVARAPGTIIVPPPSYDTGARTQPLALLDLLAHSAGAFIGGGRHHLLVSKHFEFGARGSVLWTDSETARKLRVLTGIHAEVWANGCAWRQPGEWERANREIILHGHQVWMRARDLYTHLLRGASVHASAAAEVTAVGK